MNADKSPMDIVVVASRKRPPLITEYLKEIPHEVSYTPDYQFVRRYFPAPEYRELAIKLHVGPFRCFKGHQDALRMTKGEHVLVFEDDAVPERTDWYQIAQTCIPLLEEYEIVSLHGRNIVEKERFHWNGMEFVLPNSTSPDSVIKWSLGSLAYLVKRNTADRIARMQYKGLPMDLFIASLFKYCVLEPSPFLHERKFGSLVEKAR